MHRIMSILFALFGILVLISGCTLISNPTAVSSPPVINFKVYPTETEAGKPVELLWNVTNVNSIVIDQNIGNRDAVGSLLVMPNVDTTFTLTATNIAGKSTKSASVKVLSKVASLNVSKPGTNLQTTTVNPGLKPVNPVVKKEVLRPITKISPPFKTYKETIYDFVKQAPTAVWQTFRDYKDYSEQFAFPSNDPDLRIWNDLVLENGLTYKETLFMNIPQHIRKDGVPGLNVISGKYPVTIPQNSWFTASIGMPKVSLPEWPSDQCLLHIQFGFHEMNWASGEGLGDFFVYYDDFVDVVDVDLSLDDIVGTSGWFDITVWTEAPIGYNGIPVAFANMRIARP